MRNRLASSKSRGQLANRPRAPLGANHIARWFTVSLLTAAGALSTALGACSDNNASAPVPASDAEVSGDTPDRALVDSSAIDSGPQDSSSDASIDPDATVSDTSQESPSAITSIRVHYPAGSQNLSFRGSIPPYDWNHGVPFVKGTDDTWTLNISDLSSEIEWKPLLDDTWARGPNYHVSPGQTIDIYPHFTTIAGSYSRSFELPSQILNNTRGVWIYLPPTYLENSLVHLPVIYMHDGQNLFDPAASFGGQTWQVPQTMDAAAEDGSIAEAVVVGIENTDDRMNEYTPWPDPTWNTGGKGALYLRFVVEELRPKINAQYRVLTDAPHTAIMGSSLGGIISSYAGVKYPNIFGLVGAMSPTTWWDNLAIVAAVQGTKDATIRPLRVYVDSGDSGILEGEPPNDGVLDTKTLAQAYRDLGYLDAVTLRYLVQSGGTHDEAHWAQRLPGSLQFLLGARNP